MMHKLLFIGSPRSGRRVSYQRRHRRWAGTRWGEVSKSKVGRVPATVRAGQIDRRYLEKQTGEAQAVEHDIETKRTFDIFRISYDAMEHKGDQPPTNAWKRA